MDIPIAFPVADYKVPEEYTLEQKQDALSIAEQELNVALTLSEDFFETREEMDAVLKTLRQHPDQPYTKPFMKKIASAILRVNACQQEVEWASESVADTSLTPAQVKAQVKQMVEAQRVALERQLEQRMHAERAEWMSQIRQLREELTQQITDRMQLMSQIRQLQEELDEERRHRKAFQSKVKDFSDYVYLVFASDHLDHGNMPSDSHNTMMGITGITPLYQHFSLDRRCSCGSNHFDMKDTKCGQNRLARLYRKYCDGKLFKTDLTGSISLFTLPTFDEF